MLGLPPEAACWRQETLLLERLDDWARTLLEFMGGKKVHAPGPVGDVLAVRGWRASASPEEQRPKKRKATPEEIAAWFSGHGFSVN